MQTDLILGIVWLFQKGLHFVFILKENIFKKYLYIDLFCLLHFCFIFIIGLSLLLLSEVFMISVLVEGPEVILTEQRYVTLCFKI